MDSDFYDEEETGDGFRRPEKFSRPEQYIQYLRMMLKTESWVRLHKGSSYGSIGKVVEVSPLIHADNFPVDTPQV